MRLIFLAGLLLTGAFTQEATAAPRPVIIVPGIMGSKLCKGLDDRNVLWGDAASYTFARINALRLPYDVKDRDTSIRSCGLIETVSIIPFFWESNIYSELLVTLRKPDFGYSKEDIVIFDYDWRLSNFENAERLKRTIASRFPDASSKVDIVAHSMGGLIARIYIQTLGGRDRVKNLIMLGTPHLGSATIFERLWNGFEHWPNQWSGGLTEIQKTILSFPSTYQLLPTYDECCGFSETGLTQGASYFDILSPTYWSRFTWLPGEFRSKQGFQFISSNLEVTRRLKDLLSKPIFDDPSRAADVRYIANGFIDTWSRVFFHPTTGFITGHKVNIGDGTVLLESATNALPKQVQISRKEHELLFSGPEPELVLRLALSDQQLHEAPVDFSEQLIDATNRTIQINAVDLEVEPRTAIVGETIKFTISLKSGDDAWRAADLSNLRAEIVKDGKLISSLKYVEIPKNTDPQTRLLSGVLEAPSPAGPYALRWELPGIRSYQSIFAVMQP
jgi:pimeloyl-ACP methyl ester carboxylesterase